MSELKRVLSQHHAQEMRGKLGGSAMCICGQGCGSTEACGEYAILLRDLTTATAKIEALEAKLATAERLRQTMRANLFAIYNGTWTSSGCPTLAAFADSCLEHVDNELQKENTDA